jgi:hypothetical protein
MCAKTIGKIGIMKFKLIETNENVQLVELVESKAGLYVVHIKCSDGSFERTNMIVIH